MTFSNHRFLNIFNNFIQNSHRDTIFIKVYILINFFNYINKLRKVDKQILSCSLLDLLYKSSLKKTIKFHESIFESIEFSL